MYSYRPIPYFLAALVAAIILFSLIVWRRVKPSSDHSLDNHYDPSVRLLLGLLLIGVFALGAFIMYVFLRFG